MDLTAMNTMKTKYMKGRGSKNDHLPHFTILAVDGDELEEVNEFVYLGSLVTADNDTSKEIQSIHAGNRAYFGLRKTLTSDQVQRRTKLTMCNTDQTSSPLRPRVLDNAARGRTYPWIFRPEGATNDLRWSTDGEKCVAKAHEP